jgi:hypothetical protein
MPAAWRAMARLAAAAALDIVLERFAGQRELALLLQQVLRSAAGAGEQVACCEPADIAPDRCRGRVEPFDKLLDRRRLILGEQLQQTLAAFVIHHVVSSMSRLFFMRRHIRRARPAAVCTKRVDF